MEAIMKEALVSWFKLNKALPELREDQVKSLLDYEVSNGKRKDVILRLHQRFTTLRMNRERAELLPADDAGLFN